MTPELGAVLLSRFTSVSIRLPHFGCLAHRACWLLGAETAAGQLQGFFHSNHFLALAIEAKKLDNVIWEMSDRRWLVKTSWNVLFCVVRFQPCELVMPWRCVWRFQAQPGLAQHFCFQPHSQWWQTAAHFWETPFIVWQQLSHEHRQKKSFHSNKKK